MKHSRIFLTIICFFLTDALNAQHPVLQEIFQFKGWENGIWLGNNLINPGDLNGDGYYEFISYSPNNDKAFFFWGAFPVDTIPDLVFREQEPQFPRSFQKAAVATIDGDSLIEFIIPFYGSQGHETFIYKLGVNADTLVDIILGRGGSDVCIGDLNGDGFDDIILADPDSLLGMRGRVSIYLGGEPFDTIMDHEIIGDSSFMKLGKKVTTADLNGDGYDDLIVLGNNLNIDTDFDYVRIYWGSANFDTIYDVQINDPSIDPSILGFDHRTLLSFDYNNDGYDDLFVGGIFVYNGSANFDTIPEQHIVWPSETFNAYLQAGSDNLFLAGDVNKDGFLDLAIGMPSMFGSKGLVHVKLGGPSGLDNDYIIIEPNLANQFGWAVVNIGDIDGNGVSDILIGEPAYLFNARGKLHFYSGDSTIIYEPPVGIEHLPQKPFQFQLFQNYPNPFNNNTVIEFHLSSPGFIHLKIYDIQGKFVKTLRQEQLLPGDYNSFWNGADHQGEPISSGIYFYRLTVRDAKTNATHHQTHKMLYLK